MRQTCLAVNQPLTLRPMEQEVVFLIPQFVINGHKQTVIEGDHVQIFYLQQVTYIPLESSNPSKKSSHASETTSACFRNLYDEFVPFLDEDDNTIRESLMKR